MQFIDNGTNWKVFWDGLAEWRKRRGIRVVDGDGDGDGE
jgi:hypothetical protein